MEDLSFFMAIECHNGLQVLEYHANHDSRRQQCTSFHCYFWYLTRAFGPCEFKNASHIFFRCQKFSNLAVWEFESIFFFVFFLFFFTAFIFFPLCLSFHLIFYFYLIVFEVFCYKKVLSWQGKWQCTGTPIWYLCKDFKNWYDCRCNLIGH